MDGKEAMMRLPSNSKRRTPQVELVGVGAEVVPIDADTATWWRHNRVLAKMEQDPEGYFNYLLKRVTEGEPIYQAHTRHGQHRISFVLCGDWEEMAVTLAMPAWFEGPVMVRAIAPLADETCGDYVRRCLEQQLVVTQVADTE